MRTLAVLAVALAAAGPAHAGQRIFSYDPADAETRTRIDSGLTFVFDKGLFGATRVRQVMSTEAPAKAYVEPAGERELGARLERVLPEDAWQRDLYRIVDREQGPGMVRAFCPGSTVGWLVFAPLRPRRDLVVHALGDDPAGGPARHCATLRLKFRGEWTLPPAGAPITPTTVIETPRLPL